MTVIMNLDFGTGVVFVDGVTALSLWDTYLNGMNALTKLAGDAKLFKYADEVTGFGSHLKGIYRKIWEAGIAGIYIIHFLIMEKYQEKGWKNKNPKTAHTHRHTHTHTHTIKTVFL